MTVLESLSSHYGVNPQYFHDYVKSKFDNAGLTDYDDFFIDVETMPKPVGAKQTREC